MTREEAIALFEKQLTAAQVVLDSGFGSNPGENDFLYRRRKDMAEIALASLRPVSREQVEKVWRGKWHRHYKSGIHAGNGVVCSKCDMWNNRAAHFCPSCGAPITDEAVEIVMERLEALHEITE